MTVKNRYEFKWYLALEAMAMLPTGFSIFPVPFVVPVIVICQAPVWVNIIFFGWMILGLSFIYYMEKNYP